MSGSVAQFKQLFPEFATIADDRIEFVLNCARARVSASVFGNCYLNALYYLTAHSLAMDLRAGGASGAVTQEKVGDLSRSYAKSDSTSLLASTSYGAQYLALLRMFASGGINVC
jgi:hypothetical protein